MDNNIKRRDFLKGGIAVSCAAAFARITGIAEAAEKLEESSLGAVKSTGKEKAKVYFTKDISPEGIKKLYQKVNQNIDGKVAIKVHTGEPNGPNIIPPSWVKEVQDFIPNSTIVETNVLYDSPRKTTKGHRETLKTNGWTFSEVDIMDEDGSTRLPIKGGKHLKDIAVGSHLTNYDLR